jgi:ABC-type branched-subunit amino acid transport system permease subunit
MARHLNVVLLAALAIYIYRDVYPLATYDESPRDLAEGSLLWLKVAVLGMTAVIIPLLMPRQYIPYDSKVNPIHAIPPERLISHEGSYESA